MLNLKDTIIINNQRIVWRILDGQAIIILLRKPSGKSLGIYRIYSLNNTGTRIWKLLERKLNVQGIMKILSTEFALNYKKAEKEIKRFLIELLKREVIQLN